jgi:DNA polymerase-3 subunit gamma/tau
VNVIQASVQQAPVRPISGQPVAKPVQDEALPLVKEPEPVDKPVASVQEENVTPMTVPEVGLAAEPSQPYPIQEPVKPYQLMSGTVPNEPQQPVLPKSTFLGINIGGLMNPAAEKGNALEKDAKPEEEVLPPDRTPFSQSDLERVWGPMAVKISTDLPNLHHSLTSRPPVLNDDYKIVVSVDNKIQYNEIFLKLPDILHVLRTELKNWGIQLEILITERPPEMRRPYSDQEKLDALIEKNPAIKTLKDQLNLDIDL